MNLYRVIDKTGGLWGHIAATSGAEAVGIVYADVADNPDGYLGVPKELRAIEV